MQLTLTIIFIFFLVTVPALLTMIFFVMYRYTRRMENTMLVSRAASAQAALKSAEAAEKLATLLSEAHHE